MKIPKKVRVGHIDFKVEKIKDSFEKDDYLGRSWYREQRIKINPKLSPELQQQTLLHEVIHLILDDMHYFDESKNEKLVDCLANGIYGFLKNNKLLK